MAVRVDVSKCNGCGKCIEICPVNAIKLVEKRAVVDDQCVDCETCISFCPQLAISSGAA